MEITIRDNICFMCGKEIVKNRSDDRIKAHLIPKSLNPKTNIIVIFHRDCELKLNQLYAHQQKKPEHLKAKQKILNTITDFKTKLDIMESKIKQEYEDIQDN